MGLGVKAGMLLLVPAMLGSMQYFHGTRMLLLSVFLILLYQAVIAAPFLLSETSWKEYRIRSKLTGAGRYGIQGSEPFWDYLAARQFLSITFTWVPHDVYYNKRALADKCQVFLRLFNIWFFFIRKNCFPQCFRNLWNTFSCSKDKQPTGVATHQDRRLLLELLIVQYM